MTEQTVTVPFAVRKRGGRKLVIAPDGVAGPLPLRANVDNALLKALARGFRWRKMLETGECATLRELARIEKISPSYVSRVLRLTLLSPKNVEAIVGGWQGLGTTLGPLLQHFPLDWASQAPLSSSAVGTQEIPSTGRDQLG
jgi:hypothetical protein